MTKIKFIILSLLIIALQSKFGLDIKQVYPDDTFTCFASKRLSYVAVQAYQPYGGLSPRAQQNLRQAKNRGFKTDIYMNFCNGKDPVAQVKEMLNAIPESLFDIVWVRVEENSSPGCSLTLNTPQRSCDYLRAIVGYVQTKGMIAGIYTTITFWKKIFGSASFCYQLGSKPLWYGSDDGVASFQGFSTFGGWSYPTLKTYDYGSNVCGATVNLDWGPDNGQLKKQ